MACYVIGGPAALQIALRNARMGNYPQAGLFLSWALLYAWYVVEIWLASTGINTREYRAIGTPMVVVSAVSLVWIVLQLRFSSVVWFRPGNQRERGQ